MSETSVADYMSRSPHTIGKDMSLAMASKVMREHGVRHLPVLDGGQVIGILSNRDVYLLETLKDVEESRVTVEEAMSAEPYSVPPDAGLREVVVHMCEHKYGAAVVMDGRKVVGIFTTIDALRALAERL